MEIVDRIDTVKTKIWLRTASFMISDMTEVRQGCSIPSSVQSSYFGLCATQNFTAGDVILVEGFPLIQLSSVHLSPNEQEWVESIVDLKPKSSDGVNDCVASSKKVDFSSPKFKAMVKVGLYFLFQVAKSQLSWKEDPTIADIRQLYHPPISLSDSSIQEEEHEIVELSVQAFQTVQSVLRDTLPPGRGDTETKDNFHYSPLNQAMIDLSALADGDTVGSLSSDWELHHIVQEIMLIWACNSFHGGLIYHNFSRINHSCNPNAVVVVPHEMSKDDITQCNQQKLVACCDINVDDEICISYLHGPLLYADHVTRKKILLEDKYFECSCDRCTASVDFASAIPCPVCHPRESQKSIPTSVDGVLLSEDVQYDDDQDVRYLHSMMKSQRSEQSSERKPDVEPSEMPQPSFAPLSECPVCRKVLGDIHQKPQVYRKLIGAHDSIVEKVVAFLRNPNNVDVLKGSTMSVESNSDPTTEDKNEASILIHAEQLEQLLRLSSSVLGAKHWTTNMLLLLQLNHTLTQMNARAILSATSAGSDQNDDEEDIETSIAEAIDMLERVVRFVESLHLKLSTGHLLSNVIVGTARALVSLGDVKSQKYAAKWLDRIVDFVDKFESPGMQAVVRRLHVAWQRDAGEEGNRPEKRAKR
jgi:SET domain